MEVTCVAVYFLDGFSNPEPPSPHVANKNTPDNGDAKLTQEDFRKFINTPRHVKGASYGANDNFESSFSNPSPPRHCKPGKSARKQPPTDTSTSQKKDKSIKADHLSTPYRINRKFSPIDDEEAKRRAVAEVASLVSVEESSPIDTPNNSDNIQEDRSSAEQPVPFTTHVGGLVYRQLLSKEKRPALSVYNLSKATYVYPLAQTKNTSSNIDSYLPILKVGKDPSDLSASLKEVTIRAYSNFILNICSSIGKDF